MKLGIDLFEEEWKLHGKNRPVVIVTHQGCFSSRGDPVVEVVASVVGESKVVGVCGPQHGYHLTEQDNMVETGDDRLTLGSGHPVPLWSMYSKTRDFPAGAKAALASIGGGVIVVDLPDIGCRVYTFMQTLFSVLDHAHTDPGLLEVWVLDRPNPLGLVFRGSDGRWARVEGNVLCDDDCDSTLHRDRWSYVAAPIAFRHGLTLGELGKLHIQRRLGGRGGHYRVIQVQGLRRSTSVHELQSQWPMAWPSMPSPNMPSLDTMQAFAATVMLEATNVSEGRGTTLPFVTFGAPFLRTQSVLRFISRWETSQAQNASQLLSEGVRLVPFDFRPTFNKHAGVCCHGLRMQHAFGVDAAASVHRFTLGLLILLGCCVQPGFAWRTAEQGYEYNHTRPARDLILGDERWTQFFQKVQAISKDLPSLPCELDSALWDEFLHLLEWADQSAQKWMDGLDADSIFIYT